jgi:stearoyl-CoA desaturase (delta-9 desaturase)
MMIWQIILVLSFIYFLFLGTWQEWCIIGAVYIIRSILNTVMLHRYLSHKSFKLHKWVEYLLTFLAAGGSNTSAIFWVAIHRKHHRYPDKIEDPHSPLNTSIFRIYTRTTGSGISIGYATDIIRSKFHMWCHNWHWAICLIVIALCYVIDPRSIFYIWLVPNFLAWLNGSSVNGLNHLKVGYRNHNTNDQSNNLLLTGYLCTGEGWHNNHHNEPARANFGEKWWELDPGWWVIKLIKTDK